MKNRTMKRYFCNGIEISKGEADKIEKKNQEIMKSDNISDWINCQFIVIINS